MNPRTLSFGVCLALALGLASAPAWADGPADEVWRAKAQAAVVELDHAIELNPRAADRYHERGVLHFTLGEMTEAVRDFDQVIALEPGRKLEYWQRGIALYYAGRFAEGREQFEAHQTVNPDDVENAAWHFLCVAKQEGVAAARRRLMPIRGDARVPMMTILALFVGHATGEDVLREAAAGNPGPAELRSRLCYAHLYLGLFAAANGDAKAEREHIRQAAVDYSQTHYMGVVARVHWEILQANERKKRDAKPQAGGSREVTPPLAPTPAVPQER